MPKDVATRSIAVHFQTRLGEWTSPLTTCSECFFLRLAQPATDPNPTPGSDWSVAAHRPTRLLPRARRSVLNAAIDKYICVIVKQRWRRDCSGAHVMVESLSQPYRSEWHSTGFWSLAKRPARNHLGLTMHRYLRRRR